MTPESVGIPQNKIVLGRHSGKHGLKARLKELGYTLSQEELERVYASFTELADKKKEVFDDDLRILMGDDIEQLDKNYILDYIQVSSGTNAVPTAVVRIKDGEEILEDSAIGDGPVDAVFNAVDRALNIKSEIESYQVRSVTSGRQALGEVLVRVRNSVKSFTGRGVSTDVIEASAKAYLSALEQRRQFEMEKEKINDSLSEAI